MDRRRFLSSLFGFGAAAVTVTVLGSRAEALPAMPDAVDPTGNEINAEKAVMGPGDEPAEGLVEKAYHYYRRRRYYRRRYYVRRRYYWRRRRYY